MDGKYNTNDDATVELKKAMEKSTMGKNPFQSEAEKRLKTNAKNK